MVILPHVEEALRRIEVFARRDPMGRGLARFADPRQLGEAAASLLAGERVAIVTGFCIRDAMIGENDGLSAALAIADALTKRGKAVTLVTDRHSTALLEAGANVLSTQFPIETLPSAQTEADRCIDTLLADFRPTHVLAIERPGSAADGHRYSMRGDCLDDLVPAADRLLAPPGQRDYATLAIGDGGNELGLGGLREAHLNKVPLGEKIFCVTPADHVIVAGISNWGGHALVAALDLLSGTSPDDPVARERRVLDALCAAGAVDGCTRKREVSVDGLAWADYAATLETIYREAA